MRESSNIESASQKNCSRKRRRSASAEDFISVEGKGKCKRWKGVAGEIQAELLEEMGVSLLEEGNPGIDDDIILPTSEDNDNENMKSAPPKSCPYNKSNSKRKPLNYISLNDPVEFLQTSVKKSGDRVAIVDESDEETVVQNATSEDEEVQSQNLGLEKLKPVPCKIRNSKVIYQSETEYVNNNSKDREDEMLDRKVKDDGDDDDEFFLSIRRPQELQQKEDLFNNLSDEMLLSIFQWLPRKALVRCALVCRRFCRVSYDEVLWSHVDLGRKTMTSLSLRTVLSRGCRILRLAQAAVPDPVVLEPCRLQYLDLTMAIISAAGVAALVGSCVRLKKLSLENCNLNDDCALALGRNKNLEVLNLAMCSGITKVGVEAILIGCRKLQSLNLAWTGLSSASLDVLSCNVPSRLERLNISGCRNTLTNEHVIEILHRSEDLVELDISDGVQLTNSVVDFIVSHAKHIEHLSLSRCYSVEIQRLRSLAHLKSLIYLDVFGMMTERELLELKQAMTEIFINQFLFSSIARPTVGPRRTSIWGIPVRDAVCSCRCKSKP